jgi:hypothetical protein
MTHAFMSAEFSSTLKGEDLNKKSAKNAHVNTLAENDYSRFNFQFSKLFRFGD